MANTVQQVRWVKAIVEKLFQDNSVIKRAINDNQYLNGKTVVRPQAGRLGAVHKNYSGPYPMQATPRTDDVIEYDIDKYEIEPNLLEPGEIETISYDKRNSVAEGIVMTIEDDVVDNILFAWAPDSTVTAQAANILKTTGSLRSADTDLGMTGQRKALAEADILAARLRLNKQRIPMKGRILVIPATMENDIMSMEKFIDITKITVASFAEGMIGRILGFDVYVRDRVIIASSTNAKKLITATELEDHPTIIAATDSHAALFYHEKMVAYAYGNTKSGGVHISLNPDDATYGGADVISGWVRAGGSPVRKDYKGIGMIIEE